MFTNQQYKDAYKKLPQKIRTIIVSEELSSITGDVADLFNFDEVKSVNLAKCVLNVLMRLEEKADLYKNLQFTLGIDGAAAKNLANILDQKVFSSIDDLYAAILPDPDDREENEKDTEKQPIEMEHSKELVRKIRLAREQKSLQEILNSIKTMS